MSERVKGLNAVARVVLRREFIMEHGGQSFRIRVHDAGLESQVWRRITMDVRDYEAPEGYYDIVAASPDCRELSRARSKKGNAEFADQVCQACVRLCSQARRPGEPSGRFGPARVDAGAGGEEACGRLLHAVWPAPGGLSGDDGETATIT